MITVELSEVEIKEILKGFPECPVGKLLKGINNYSGSDEGLEELYELLVWIESHEGELARLRRMVEQKIIDYRFRDVKV